MAPDAPLRVANPIYAEVLPRELAWAAQETLDLSPPRYMRADGSLDADLLMEEFQSFFRRNSGHWRTRFAYEEAWPQRAGVRSRERTGRPADLVAAGRPGAGVRGGVQGGPRARWAGERHGRGRGADGEVRVSLRCRGGHLIVIDRRENRSWEEKVFHLRRHAAHQRRGQGAVPVDVWGM